MSNRKILLHILLSIPFLTGYAFAETDQGDPKALNLGEIVVTAEKMQEYVKNHPQDVKIVERKEIDERNLANVEDILKTMPGVEVYSTAGIGSRISIRGSGRTGGVLMLLNGRPMNSNQYSSQDLNAIPVDLIESISVFKPPVPVWLGPGGSDGAINIITRTKDKSKDTENAASTVKLNGGSYGFAESSLSHQLPVADGNALISATAGHRDGSRPNSDRTNGALAMSWNRKTADGSSYQLGSRYYRAEFGSPGPIDNLTPDARQDYQKLSIDSKYQGILGEIGNLAATLYGDAMTLEDKGQSGKTATLNDQKVGLKADTTWSEDSGAWNLRLGISSEWDQFDHTLAGDHHRFAGGINSQYDYRLGDFTPTLGLRGDYTDDFDFNPGFITGIGWGITKECLLKLKGGYSVKVPTFEQLYQTTHGSIDQSRGNPDLNEERIWSYDLGIEYTFAKDRLIQMTIFRTDIADLITSERGEDLIYRPTNLDRAMRQGIEITGKYAWEIGLTMETSLTLQESENKDTGKELPYTPTVKVKETISYAVPGLKTRLEGSIRYEGNRYSQMENLPAQELDSYTVLDLKLTQPFMLAGFATDGYLKIDNLFDTAYESHFGYPADGIVATTGLQIKF